MADDALHQLSLEEKAALLTGADYWRTKAFPDAGVRSIMLADGPHGLRKQSDDADHLGLNTSEPATCFPTPAALAASWDEQLLEAVGQAIGREARCHGVHVLLGPGANIKRDPRCGRNFEYYSEDPLHSGRTAAAFIKGVQSQGVAACLKHFAANNQETDRLRVSAEIDARTMREIYLAGFEHAIQNSQPWTVMSSYNRVNGSYAGESHWLLTDVLRTQWGWDGAIISDWGAVFDRLPTLEAGLDLEMPYSGGHTERELIEAVNDGRLDMATLDAAAERVLRLIERVAVTSEPFDAAAHHTLARRAAAQACVLLRNEPVRDDATPILPLLGDEHIAVIGEFARTPRFQGAGSAQVVPTQLPTALEALAERGVEVEFAPGFHLDGALDEHLIDEAVAAAQASDVSLLFLGLPPASESEGYDRDTLLLPDAQLALLNSVRAVAKHVVVVLANGSVVVLDEVVRHSDAIIEAWLGGQAMAEGVLDVLFGDVNPSGRLPETVPHRLEDVPSFLHFPGELGESRYSEGIFVGYRGYDRRDQSVTYPFGHGLTYTTFELQITGATVTGIGADTSASVDVCVRNTGSRHGAEVVQLYVEAPASEVVRPPRELRGFARIELDPGEEGTVQIALDSRAFAYWHSVLERWVVEGGEYRLHVGRSSRDIADAVDVEVQGDSVRTPLTRMSTLGELMQDPVIGQRISAIVAEQPEQFQRQAPDIPAITFVDFNIFDLDRDELDALLHEANHLDTLS